LTTESVKGRSADGLATTSAECACLGALREATGESAGAIERHCVRQFVIAERLAESASDEVDRELLLCAALLHDAGLYPGVSTGDVYVSDSRRLAERTLAPFGWPEARLARFLDAIEQHHALRARWDWGVEVELMRRSDLVDVTRGLVAFGLERAWLRKLFEDVSRAGFYRMLAREIARMLRERPLTLLRISTPRSVPSSAFSRTSV
jgi:HD superfamily phosphodiesterase